MFLYVFEGVDVTLYRFLGALDPFCAKARPRSFSATEKVRVEAPAFYFDLVVYAEILSQ